MMRKLLAILLGWALAFGLIALIEAAGHKVYPPPPDFDFTKPADVARYVQLMPLGAFGFVLAAWAVGTFCGALLACRIAGENPLMFASIIGAAVLAATAMNLLTIPHPTWFSITGVVLIMAAAFLAARISSGE